MANHAGAIPADAPVIMHGIEEELGRAVYGLADYLFRSLPVVGTAWSRGGGVAAHPDNAYRLLESSSNWSWSFPKGTKGTGKLYSQRYQLRRFGRGGFVEIAMRAGVPVVPITVVGSEEAMPTWPGAAPGEAAAGALRSADRQHARASARWAWSPTSRPSSCSGSWTRSSFDVPADQERYPRSRVFEEAEAIRQDMQASLYDMLRHRRSVWFG